MTEAECEAAVVRAAMALSDVYAEFDGQPDCIGEHLDALWTACDRLKSERVAAFLAPHMPSQKGDGHEFSEGYKRNLAAANERRWG